MTERLLWLGLFALLLLAYIFIQYTVRAKKRYFFYFLAGVVFGFYFDIVSVTQGYYLYPDHFVSRVWGVPLLLTLAEGFSVVITLYIFEFLKNAVRTRSVSLKNMP